MATITTDTYLDDGTARTAGEAWTCNGGVLTVRTDTRYHAGSPISMTGSLGSATISATLGGGYFIDGRSVRWLAYDTGTGTVPAIGTSITQGGVAGYLLGVYSSLSVAPTVAGAATPASGFIKFREVTGGAFSAGALTGIGASATAADVTGWIEVVHDQSATLTLPRLGEGFAVSGEWFYLDSASGSRGQQIQIPTNGGGAGTLVPGVQIETASGVGSYEWYPAITVAQGWTNTQIFTDARAKLVEAMAGGIIRIGSNGTNDIGYLPPAGCKIRIPNVIGRQCATGSRASNATPHTTMGTRPEFLTTSAGSLYVDKFITDWYFNLTSPYNLDIRNFCIADQLSITNCPSAYLVSGGCNGSLVSTAVQSLNLSANVNGGTISDWKILKTTSASSSYGLYATSCNGLTFNDLYAINTVVARTTASYAIYANICTDMTISGVHLIGQTLAIAGCDGINVYNVDYIDRLFGDTDANQGIRVFNISNSANVLIDGITFGAGGTIAETQPYADLIRFSSNLSNIKVRNAGTKAAPLSAGSNASFYPNNVVSTAGNDNGIKLQRIYLTNTRGEPLNLLNTCKNIVAEHVYGSQSSATQALEPVDSYIRGCGVLNLVTAQSAVYGSLWYDMFTSDTAGRVMFCANEPTVASQPYVTLTLSGSAGGFTSANQCAMPTLGDNLIAEMLYFAIGHSGFENTAATLTGTNTGNFSYEYQIDTGSGWNGSWNTLDGATLSAETVDPSVGFKLKLKIATTSASTTNAITSVRINTLSSAADQENNLYPLDENFVTLSTVGLLPNSRLQLYNITASGEMANTYVTSGEYSVVFDTLASGAIATDGDTLRFRATKLGYLPYETFAIFGGEDTSFLVDQEIDTVYVTNGLDGSTITEFSLDIPNVEIDLNDPDGVTTVQRGYAWFNHILTTESGIRSAFMGFEAIDEINYRANSEIINFKFDNVNVDPLHITGGYVFRSDGAQIIASGSGPLFLDAGKAYLATSAGVTASGVWDHILEGTLTAKEIQRVLLAVAAGISDITDLGGGAATVKFYSQDGLTTRVEADMTGSERTDTTVNGA